MKNKFLMLFVMIIVCITLASCGSDDDNALTYTPDATTQQADYMFEQNSTADLKNLCKIMSGNNDYPQERDNFFNYILAKTMEIDSTDDTDKFEICLDVIETCLDQPLTQAHVVSGLKQTYLSVDSKLTEQTRQYMTGKWRRIDSTVLSGMVVEVFDSEEYGFCSKIAALPDDSEIKFRINDIKWADIQFANHKKFYIQDLVTEESNGTTYYKNDSKTVTKFKGATATIDFETDKIVITYDAASGVTTGSRQVWLKVDSANDIAYQAGEYYDTPDDTNEDIEDGESGDTDDSAQDEQDDFSLSGGKISNTTATATSMEDEEQ